MKKLTAVILAAAVVILSALCACDMPTCHSMSMDSPLPRVEQFVQCMKSEDFSGAMELVQSGTDIDFFVGRTALENDEVSSVIYSALIESYGIEFPDDAYSISGRYAEIRFNFTYLDIEGLSDRLNALIAESGKERMYYGEVFDTEEKALALMHDVFIESFSGSCPEYNIKDYYVTREIEISAEFSQDGWMLIIGDDFYKALTGK